MADWMRSTIFEEKNIRYLGERRVGINFDEKGRVGWTPLVKWMDAKRNAFITIHVCDMRWRGEDLSQGSKSENSAAPFSAARPSLV